MLNGVHVPALMLADDVSLLSWTWVAMQKKLRIFQEFCHQWRLIAHVKGKTKAMLLGAPGAEAPLEFCREDLPYTDEYPLNGFVVRRSSGTGWDASSHVKNIIHKSKAASHSLMALRNKMGLHLLTMPQHVQSTGGAQPNLLLNRASIVGLTYRIKWLQ